MLYGAQWTVQYRCSYREYWYDDREFENPILAMQYADSLAQSTGRKTRIVDQQGNVVYYSMVW
jgi:hypothetical protein